MASNEDFNKRLLDLEKKVKKIEDTLVLLSTKGKRGPKILNSSDLVGMKVDLELIRRMKMFYERKRSENNSYVTRVISGKERGFQNTTLTQYAPSWPKRFRIEALRHVTSTGQVFAFHKLSAIGTPKLTTRDNQRKLIVSFVPATLPEVVEANVKGELNRMPLELVEQYLKQLEKRIEDEDKIDQP